MAEERPLTSGEWSILGLLNEAPAHGWALSVALSPNGDIGADSVTDTLIHEISETVTDPNISAWYTKGGLENGDLCNFVYGQTFTAANGSHANQTFGNRQYLVQTIWANVGAGYCALSYP